MDTNEIIIEQVTAFSPEIVDAISAFVRKLGNNYQPFTEDSLQEIINSPQSYLFIARHIPTKKIAGMIMEIVYRIPYTKKAYIEDLFVDEQFRKMGIATRLMQKTLDTAKEHHAAYVDFTSQPHRVEGNTLYEKLGFKKRDTNVYRLKIIYEEV
ncbi:MAG TPA: GNAT family N-acetyltransferase [Candidatus Acidoferrales bacterium]|nr:GNAT family N-acetyltransferase [Candidatus Acidoferrales bacterium]